MLTIKEARERKGISKKAVCRELSMTYPTYTKYEADPKQMKVEDAFKLCDFLNVSFDDIFFGVTF